MNELRDHFILRGCAGVRKLPRSTLLELHKYAGAQVAFYFAWVSTYTRLLWWPTLLGFGLFLSDQLYYDGHLGRTFHGNSSELGSGGGEELGSGPGDASSASSASGYDASDQQEDRFNRATLTAGFGLLMVLWAAGFEELWKRRSATVATEWGENHPATTQAVNQHFKSKGVREGFYTADGLFVALDNVKDSLWKPQQLGRPPAPPPKVTDSHRRARDGADRERRERLASAIPGAAPHPREVFFPPHVRERRQHTARLVLVGMGVACLACIFLMQLFAAYMETQRFHIGGVDLSSYVYSVANAIMIAFFNVVWRTIALWLSSWENYRLEEKHLLRSSNPPATAREPARAFHGSKRPPLAGSLSAVLGRVAAGTGCTSPTERRAWARGCRYRLHLTYKLFAFQCLNCYFSLLYIAFLKPFGIQLFGIQMRACYTESVRPATAADDEHNCADELRALLLSILLINILLGQVTEVGHWPPSLAPAHPRPSSADTLRPPSHSHVGLPRALCSHSQLSPSPSSSFTGGLRPLERQGPRPPGAPGPLLHRAAPHPAKDEGTERQQEADQQDCAHGERRRVERRRSERRLPEPRVRSLVGRAARSRGDLARGRKAQGRRCAHARRGGAVRRAEDDD